MNVPRFSPCHHQKGGRQVTVNTRRVFWVYGGDWRWFHPCNNTIPHSMGSLCEEVRVSQRLPIISYRSKVCRKYNGRSAQFAGWLLQQVQQSESTAQQKASIISGTYHIDHHCNCWRSKTTQPDKVGVYQVAFLTWYHLLAKSLCISRLSRCHHSDLKRHTWVLEHALIEKKNSLVLLSQDRLARCYTAAFQFKIVCTSMWVLLGPCKRPMVSLLQ